MKHMTEMGRISLGSRLKRLSDYLVTEVNAIYKANHINFEASSFPLLSLLERYGPHSLREAEEKLGTSHSYISQKSKYLLGQGLIEMTVDPNDGRSKNLSLTPKGFALIEKMRPIWKSLDISLANALGMEEREIFHSLLKLEQAFTDSEVRLRDAVAHEMARSRDFNEVEIVEYRPEFKDAFANLNLEWLEKSFTLTDFDHQAFADPQRTIIDKGGAIYFAVMGGQPVGTAALYPESADAFELCKMGVDPRFRGHGIGRKLVETGIEKARQMGAKDITLLTTSHKLQPAVRLYRSLGFIEVPLTEHDIAKYGTGRIDTRMVMPLTQKKKAV